MKKPWACRLGFHKVYLDHVGENVGTEFVPVLIFTTFRACNFCDYRKEIL